jgi:hypothetical protein
MWHHQVHFGMKIGFPQTTLSCPRKVEKYKREFCRLFYFILNIGPLEPWRDPRLSPATQQYTNSARQFHLFLGILHLNHGSHHNLSKKTRSRGK